MNKTEIKNTIIEGLKGAAKFHEDLCAGKGLDTINAGYTGYLRSAFRLSTIRKWLEFKQYQDPLILAVFDALSAQRKIKVFMVSASRDLHHNDLWIKVEIGRGVRRLRTEGHGWDYDQITFYFDSPMSVAEFKQGGCTITKISEKVAEIRERRDKHFGKQFGTRDFPAEEKLYREIREDNARENIALKVIAESFTSRKRESENV